MLDSIDRPASLKDEAYTRIKQLILSDDLAGEDRLAVESLISELGISRTPVREALVRLEQEGLVTIVPNKGTFLTRLTQAEVREIYQVREALEALAARLATAHIPDEELENLQAEFAHVRDDMEVESYDRHFRSDTRLHELILDHCGSDILRETIESLTDRVHRVRRFSLLSHSGGHLERSFEEHCQILDALSERDAEAAERLMAKHIRDAGSRIAALFRSDVH